MATTKPSISTKRAKKTGPVRPDPATLYAEDVLAGKVVAGRLVRLACERHMRDMADPAAHGLKPLNAVWVSRVFKFFGMLHHSKGEWAGRTFVPEDWQRFILASIFGWERLDGTRRYRTSYVSTARKSGKSTLAAGVGLYAFLADNEPGAEVVTASTKRDQSRIVHSEAIRMVQSSPELRPIVTVMKDNLSVPARHSKYEPLGADADTLDGLNLSAIVADEVHAWRGRQLWDVLETATGARRQPLLFSITTAGFDKQSLAYTLHDYSIKVLEGTLQDDSFFAYIATLDEGDDWQDEAVWPKANPNINVSVKITSLREECERAKSLPSAVNAFRRLRMNEWTESHSQWISPETWNECASPINIDDLQGKDCTAGLDLSSTSDLTALTLLFSDGAGGYTLIPFFWVPEANARQRADRDRVPYPEWIRAGYIEATPGNVVDQNFIRERIKQLASMFHIRELAYDRWNSTMLISNLTDDGLTCVPIGLGIASMSPPTKEFERLVLAKKIRHAGDPVFGWNLANVAIYTDAAGNQKPDKGKSTEKIDGVVAALLALARAMANPEPAGSIYDDPENLEPVWVGLD